jgi:hypothetical protein
MKKINWIFITLAFLLLFLLFFFIVVSYQGKIRLSMPVYFFLLIVCDLAVTGFLTNALKSSAEYSGNVYKGNLKISGAALIFIIILIIGYKYKPNQQEQPFDLTFIITSAEKQQNYKGTVRIELGNSPRKQPIDEEDKAIFPNIDARYLGESIPVSVQIEGYKSKIDTFITIPDEPLPAIRLSVSKSIDSTLFSGYVFKSNPGKKFVPISNAVLNFPDFDKKVMTDSTGYFKLYLPLKTGSSSTITIFKNNNWIFSDRVTLSNNMQILTNE